jgi:hypothetical protein
MLSWTGVASRECGRRLNRVPCAPGLRPAAVWDSIVVERRTLSFSPAAPTLRRQRTLPQAPSVDQPLAADSRKWSRTEAVTLLGQMDERGTVTGFRITPSWGDSWPVSAGKVGGLLRSPRGLSDPRSSSKPRSGLRRLHYAGTTSEASRAAQGFLGRSSVVSVSAPALPFARWTFTDH